MKEKLFHLWYTKKKTIIIVLSLILIFLIGVLLFANLFGYSDYCKQADYFRNMIANSSASQIESEALYSKYVFPEKRSATLSLVYGTLISLVITSTLGTILLILPKIRKFQSQALKQTGFLDKFGFTPNFSDMDNKNNPAENDKKDK